MSRPIDGPVSDAARQEHWRALADDRPPALELPLLRVGAPSATDIDRERIEFALEPEVARPFRAFLEREGATVSDGLLAAWIATLYRTARQDDLLIGLRGNGRTSALRLALGDKPGFRELVRRTRRELGRAREHALDLAALLRATRCARIDSLFQVLFAAETVSDAEAARLDLVLSVDAQEAAGELGFDPARLAPAAAMQMLGHLEMLVRGALKRPDESIGRLPFLTEPERAQILQRWNDTGHEFPRDSCLHDLFAEAARRCPDAPAVVFDGRSLTFAALDARANRLAHRLRSLGVGPDVLGGICVERSFELVIGLLSIAKSGGAYLPMDPAYPRERLAFMLSDSGVGVLLTQEHLARALPEPERDVHVVLLDGAERGSGRLPSTAPEPGVDAENLAYVIYTSGSTGKPKGVVLDHRGRVNNFLDFNRRFAVRTGDALIALASLSFDMCAYDVFGTLAAGATIVMPRPEELLDPAAWARLRREQRVTIWHTAPALLQMLVEHVEERPEVAPPALRLALLGGDWIPVTLPDRLRALVPGARVVSMGGATECSMDSTIFEIGPVDPEWRSIPYGAPMANQLAYVLDEDLQPLPVGVPGELYLGGIGVGKGYLGRPELTAERFLADPFAAPGARMYKTGDLARWRPDGNLELLGRIDNQVKLRGYRIELGEIEARLRAHPGVKEAVVAACADSSGEKRLVAYFVPHATGASLDALRSELRAFLAAELPVHMLPAFFTALEALPLSPNGKVDRKRLPAPDTSRPGASGAFVAARDALEELVAGIWADVLGFEEVGVEHAFLELGGHSILAVQIQSRLEQVFPCEVALADVFEARTVAGLCAQLRAACRHSGADADDVARTWRSISALSDADVAARLKTGS